MALKRYEKYPNRWLPATPEQPQGAFKNRTTSVSKDGSYIEKDWANDWSGFFGAALNKANIVPNGEVDTALSSQYYEAFRTFFYNPENKPNAVDIGAADRSHGHQIANVNGLQSALDSKSANGHKHNISDVISLQASLDSKVNKSGDIMTGSLTIKSSASSSNVVKVQSSSGESVALQFVGKTAGVRIGGDGESDKNGFAVFSAADYLAMRVTAAGEIYAAGAARRVYHEGFKPSAADVKALPITGGTTSGSIIVSNCVSLNVDGDKEGSVFVSTKGGASAALKFINETACIRVGGTGSASANGFAFYSTGDKLLGKFGDDSQIYAGTYKVYHQGYKPSAADVGAYTKAESDARMLGVGQKWQNVTSSRTLSTNYTNSTGRPIQIFVSTVPNRDACNAQITVDGVVVATMGLGGNQNLDFTRHTSVSAIIPVGAVYKVDASSIQLWSELS